MSDMNLVVTMTSNDMEAIDCIAKVARRRIEQDGETVEEALDVAAVRFVRAADALRVKSTVFDSKQKRANLQWWLFLSSIAKDIIEGTTARVTVGNVRMTALDAVRNGSEG